MMKFSRQTMHLSSYFGCRPFGAQSRMQIPAATRMWALTFGSRSCLRSTKPKAESSRDPNVRLCSGTKPLHKINTNISTNIQTCNGLTPEHSRDPNVSAHIRIAVVPAEHKPETDPSRDLKVSTHLRIAALLWDQTIKQKITNMSTKKHSHSNRGYALGPNHRSTKPNRDPIRRDKIPRPKYFLKCPVVRREKVDPGAGHVGRRKKD